MLHSSSSPQNATQPHKQTEESPVSNQHVILSAEDVADRNVTGGRWPPEETKALLKIRSAMDAHFRDAFTKVHLWEQVSGKLGELGYSRSAKKCQEKFENVYKYCRRTKEGRYGRTNGKTYRFFELLEPLMNSPYPEKNGKEARNTATTTIPKDMSNVIQGAIQHPYPEKNEKQITAHMDLSNVIQDSILHSIRFSSDPISSTTHSSGEESEEGIQKKKKKLSQHFEGLMNKVLERQAKLQKNFMEILLKCEQDRMAREEAWKMQELARIKRERELLAQERSIAAAKDAAVLALLRKFTAQTGTIELPENLPPDDLDKDDGENDNAGSGVIEKQECRNGGYFTLTSSSSSRWPKDEVEALIRLRTNFNVENEGNGVKGSIHMWDEISCAMEKLGYDRSAKRCKEKWENMNKYFKRMKKTNQKKRQDSKTCPFFNQLDALYNDNENPNEKVEDSASSDKDQLKPEELLMHFMEVQSRSSSEDADRNEGSE